MNNWYIVGYHIQLGSGIIRGPLDQFTAYRLHKQFIRDYPTALLRLINECDITTVNRIAADYLQSLGVRDTSIDGSVDGYWADLSSARVDTIEYKSEFTPRGFDQLRPLTVLPDDPRYDSYVKMLDDIIRDDWDMVEEIAYGLVQGHTPVIIEHHKNLLSDLYFRKNYLDLRSRNL